MLNVKILQFNYVPLETSKINYIPSCTTTFDAKSSYKSGLRELPLRCFIMLNTKVCPHMELSINTYFFMLISFNKWCTINTDLINGSGWVCLTNFVYRQTYKMVFSYVSNLFVDKIIIFFPNMTEIIISISTRASNVKVSIIISHQEKFLFMIIKVCTQPILKFKAGIFI